MAIVDTDVFHEMGYVLAVQEAGSFSRAAEKLYIAQPSLSLMVKKAEARIGTPLFDRGATPLALTEAGREYVRAAQQIRDIQAGFLSHLRDVAGCLTGRLSFGGTALFTAYVLPPLLSAFSSRYPGVKISLKELHTGSLEKALLEGDVDLIVDNCRLGEKSCVGQPYQGEEMLLTVPAALEVNRRAQAYALSAREAADPERLRQADPVPLSWFAQEDFLLLKGQNDTRRRAELLFHEAGFRPRVRLELDEQITSYNIASCGLGVCFISDTLIRHIAPEERLLFYRLDPRYSKRFVQFYHRARRPLTRPMEAFLALLDEKKTAQPQVRD